MLTTHRRSLRAIAVWFCAAASLAPAVAHSHAVIVRASPSVGAQVAAGDIDVVLEFNSRIDVERSQLALRDPAGAPVAVTHAASGRNVLAGRARLVAPGRWSVHWQVLSIDGHITRGDIPFVVLPR